MNILMGLMIVSACSLCQACGGERVASSSQHTEQGEKAVSNANTTANEMSGEDHYHKANNLKQALEMEEALKEYYLAIENGYDTVELRIDLGEILSNQMNREEEGAEQFRIAVKRDQTNWRAHWRLAQALLATKQYDEALRELGIIKRFDPEYDAEGFYTLETAKALDGLERYDEALKEYEGFLLHFGKTSPKEPDVLKARERIKAIKEQLNRN